MKKDNNNNNLPAQAEQSVTPESPSQDRPSRGLKLQSNVKAGGIIIVGGGGAIYRNTDEPEQPN